MRIIAAFEFVLLTSMAEAADVDWKMYGGASDPGTMFCFYDTNSVAHPSSGVIRFWTKCLLQKDLDVKFTKQEVDDIARKALDGYVPPLIVIKELEFEKRMDIMMYEAIADRGTVKAQSKFLIEINCTEQMYQRLDASLIVDGKLEFLHKPSEWGYIPPETNPANLLKMLCPGQ
jgi:hypothetical protein